VRQVSLAGRAIIALASLGLAWTGPALAQTSEDLDGVERQLQENAEKASELEHQAQALNGEIARLRKALIAGAKAVQDAEQQVSEVETTLAELETRERERSVDLAARRAELGRVLMALERLSIRPTLALFFTDRAPITEARAMRLLAIAGETLNQRAGSLVAELAELGELRAQVARRRADLSQAVGKLSDENQKLTQLLKKKAGLQASTLQESDAARERMDELSEQARNLKELLDRLEAARAMETSPPDQTAALAPTPGPEGPEAPPVAIREFPETGTPLVRPVRGKIAAGFGQSTEALGQSTGLVFAARSAAEVVAPYDGRIVFEGPFRSYGQILIIEHSGGYHSVLAGLGLAEVSVGQWLLAGEPVGSMAEGSEGSRLYFELRHNGQPVDPTPWLDAPGAAGDQSN
jgi:septal ring factor EnvC (AmiA/AmiB activator)